MDTDTDRDGQLCVDDENIGDHSNGNGNGGNGNGDVATELKNPYPMGVRRDMSDPLSYPNLGVLRRGRDRSKGRRKTAHSCPPTPHGGSHGGGGGLSVSGSGTPIPGLHQSMTHQHRRGRDPFKNYEVVRTLGSGSMGSVSLVRKRRDAIGGSARVSQKVEPEGSWRKKRERMMMMGSSGETTDGMRGVCWPCFSLPLLGGLFRSCFGKFNRGKDGSGFTTVESESSLAKAVTTTRARSAAFALLAAIPSGDIGDDYSSEAGGSARSARSGYGSANPSATVTPNPSLRDGRWLSQDREHNLLLDATTATSSGGGSVPPSSRSSVRSMGARSSSQHAPIIAPGGSYEARYALKSIKLDCVADPTCLAELRNEIDILKTLDHPNIVKPIETFEKRNKLYLVLELCTGGDLYSRDPYTEDQAANILESILNAVAYMHNLRICHRDLKYENVMFVNESPTSEVKIIDFGLSAKYGQGKDEGKFSRGVGTIYTMAPEVIKGEYDSQADLWSVGVLAYMLLSSQMPFYGKGMKKVARNIVKGEYDFVGRRWRSISAQAKEFVSDLLQLDPRERPTAEKALSYAWLNRRYNATQRQPILGVMESVHATLETYASYSKLKRLALMVIAHKSTSQEIGDLRKAFESIDVDSDGMISYEELRRDLSNEYTNEEVERMFQAADLDGDGKLAWTEFLAATMESGGGINEERFAEAFDRLDTDNDGFISTSNLREILGKDFPKSEIDEIIDEADLTHDHKISYNDFLALWTEEVDEDEHVEITEEFLPQSLSALDNGVPDGREYVEGSDHDSEDVSSDDEGDSRKEPQLLAHAQFTAEKAKSLRRLKVRGHSGLFM